MIASIYRAPKRDRHGDPVDANGDLSGLDFIGQATGVILGGLSARRAPVRGEVADTTGQIGFPRSGLIPTHGDRVVVEGEVFEVVGKPQWNHDHPLTGTDMGYAWVDVMSRTN